MGRVLTIGAAGAVALSLAACSAEDVAEKAGVATVADIREVRAQRTLDDFFGALSDQDWSAACSHLTRDGFNQLMRAARAPGVVPFNRCPEALGAAFRDAPNEVLASAKVTKAEPSPGQGIRVETDAGEVFTMDGQYRIAHFDQP